MTALATWIQKVPAPPAPSWVDPAAAARGAALFSRADVGCSRCHSGAKFTNNQTLDVGTGQAFQVPPLVGVGWRTPLFHDGCAQTIADRFGACSTPAHGNISTLTTQNISDMINDGFTNVIPILDNIEELATYDKKIKGNRKVKIGIRIAAEEELKHECGDDDRDGGHPAAIWI